MNTNNTEYILFKLISLYKRSSDRLLFKIDFFFFNYLKIILLQSQYFPNKISKSHFGFIVKMVKSNS